MYAVAVQNLRNDETFIVKVFDDRVDAKRYYEEWATVKSARVMFMQVLVRTG